MATIVPFQGIRFNEQTEALNKLVTPPYDVIDVESQDAFYQSSPYNIIRLEYGKKYNNDSQSSNRYTRAAEFFGKWRKQDVLVKDEEPSLYLYQQEFEVNNEKRVRTGFVCGVKLEPYENGIVLPHEETMPKHKADRLELMRACKANFSPIFGLFTDRERLVDKLLLETAQGRQPDVEFTDGDKQVHRMWVISDPVIIAKIQESMGEHKVFIADGHHRYETALAYRDERRNSDANTTGIKPYDYVMMTLVNLYDPGLTILPTHRLVKQVDNTERFLSQLEGEFSVENIDLDQHYGSPEKIESLLKDRACLDESEGTKQRHVFVVYNGQHCLRLVTLKDDQKLQAMMPAGHSDAWHRLDVSVLQNLVLEKHLGIGREERASGEYLKYTRDGNEVFRDVDNGNFDLGIFMNPTLMEEVIQVASGGEKMPQKSTFFFPKLITGLVINEL
ncbi:MAG: DUF1015 domain-containing protein [Firmicutes bacterium]|nr:DUF1015 domain-containing protein [Bacillota bacterium]